MNDELQGFGATIFDQDGFRSVPSALGTDSPREVVLRAATGEATLAERYAMTLRTLAELALAVGPIPNELLPKDHKDQEYLASDFGLQAEQPDFYDPRMHTAAAFVWLAAVRRDLPAALSCNKGQTCRCWENVYNLLALGEAQRIASEEGMPLHDADLSDMPAWPLGEGRHLKPVRDLIEAGLKSGEPQANRIVRIREMRRAEQEARRREVMGSLLGSILGELGKEG